MESVGSQNKSPVVISIDFSLLSSLTGIARQAGDAIMTYYGMDIAVSEKDDSSPVTEADQQAEDIIAGELIKLDAAIPLVAEERFASGRRPDITGQPFWLVDPLDGTKEFLSRNGEFTVNIALIDQSRPIIGIVHAPALGATYFGGHSLGAFLLQGDSDAETITARVRPDRGLSVVASRSHGGGPDMENFLDGLDVADFKAAGSSLKFCLLARGAADLYPRFGRTMEWDTAAGHAVLTAAGGRVVKSENGEPLLYGKTGFANPYFVAHGRED